jgi:hypothetical protein
MSDDLIKRVCQSWVDAGWGDDPFWEHWPECPTDDTLSAKQVLDRIEELERERDEALAAQPYTYIGKDMKPILARVLEDAKDAAEVKLAKAVEALWSLIEATTVPEANICITRALTDARALLAELEKES